jgi:alpha-tubulin suppressor-like RCC1 family protein
LQLIGTVAVLMAGCPTTARAATLKPEISTFEANPTSLGSAGGEVQFSAVVSFASSCSLTATPAFPGLPTGVPCPPDAQLPAVLIPANVTAKTVKYKFVLTASGLFGAKTKSAKSKPLTITVSPPPPATYVALGDSYSSGEGNPSKSSKGTWVDTQGKPTSIENGCDRSAIGYPMLLSKWLKSQQEFPPLSLRFLACSGATTEDLWDSGAQAAGLKGPGGREAQQLTDTGDLQAARLVSVSIGGDDLNFADILKNCTLEECDAHSGDPWIADLAGHITALEPILIHTYERIETEAPQASLFVLGYPDIFPTNPTPEELDATCPSATAVPAFEMTPEGIEYLIANQRLLGEMIERAALAAHAHFVDPNAPGPHSFSGHDICAGKQSWLNKPDLAHIQYSYHPNKSGQAAFAAELEAAIADANSVPPGGLSIGIGTFHTCAVLVVGGVECWGRNDAGQLGDGEITCSSCANDLPRPVIGLSNSARAVTGGVGHTCALLVSGAVECWGLNLYGQLGSGSSDTGDSTTPVPVGGALAGATQLSAGGFHVCALEAGSGQVLCWGENQYGQVGDGTTEDARQATAVTGLSGASSVAAGMGSYSTCAIVAGGHVDCWGENRWGQLGNGTTNTGPTIAPTPVIGISNAVALSGGERHFCALLANHTISCWGSDQWGQLGDGSTNDSAEPVSVHGITNAIAIAAGYHYTCALLATGAADCWGENQYGQLGNQSLGLGGQSSEPVPVQGLPGSASQLTSGADHTCTLSAATIDCWGRGAFGQLGDGETSNTAIPHQVQLGI